MCPNHTMKITLCNKVQLTVTVFSQGSHEQFLSQVQTALETTWQKGLLAAYDKACEKNKEREKSLLKPLRPTTATGIQTKKR